MQPFITESDISAEDADFYQRVADGLPVVFDFESIVSADNTVVSDPSEPSDSEPSDQSDSELSDSEPSDQDDSELSDSEPSDQDDSELSDQDDSELSDSEPSEPSA